MLIEKEQTIHITAEQEESIKQIAEPEIAWHQRERGGTLYGYWALDLTEPVLYVVENGGRWWLELYEVSFGGGWFKFVYDEDGELVEYEEDGTEEY